MRRVGLLFPLLLFSGANPNGLSAPPGPAEVEAGSVETQRRRTQRLPAHYAAFEKKDDEENMSRVVLRNGLTIVIEEQAIRPLAAVVTYVKAGYLQESGSELGAARAWAKIFQDYSEAASRIRRAGGWLEARAAADHIAFTVVAPADNALDAIEISSLLLQQPASLRTVSRKETPEIPAADGEKAKLWEMAFGERGARLASDGSAPAPSAEALLSFHNAHFTPGKTVLAISGTVNREVLLKEIVEQYGRLKGEGSPVEAPDVPLTFEPGKRGFASAQLQAETDSPLLSLAYRVPGPDHPDALMVELLSTALGTGRGALLQRLISSGAALEADAELAARPGGGLLRIAVRPAAAQLDRAEVEALSFIGNLRSQPVGTAQLNRAKALLLKRHYQRLASLQGRAHLLAEQEARGSYKGWARIPQQIAEASAAQLQKVAATYLDESNLVLLESLPPGAEPRTLSGEKLLETLDLLVKAGAEQAQARFQLWQGQGDEPAFELRSFEPSLVKRPLKRTSVLRGPRVFIEEEHLVPLLQVGFFFAGGRVEEGETNAGLTDLMWRSVMRGIDSQAGPQAWRSLERHGAEFRVVVEPDFHGLQVSLLSSGLSDLLETVTGWLREPPLSKEAVAFEIERMKAEAAEWEQRPWRKALAAVDSELFEGHPYSMSRLGSEASRSSLDVEQVRGWAGQLKEIHPVIIVRGDVGGTSFLPPLLRVLSNSKMGQKPAVRINAPLKKNLVTAAQSGFSVAGFPGPTRGSRDAWTTDVLGSLVELWGGFAPPQDDVRRGPAPRLFHRSFLGGGVVYVALPPASEKESLGAQLQKAAALKSAAIRNQDALQSIVLTISRFHDRRQQGDRYLVDLAASLMAGEKPGFETEYLATIKGAKVDDLRDLSGRFLRAPPARVNSLEGTPPGQGNR